MLNQTDHQNVPAGTKSQVTVHLFAGVAQLAGQRQICLHPQSPTVAGIRAALLAALPQIEPLLSRSAIVVEGRYAAADETVEMAAEIAVIPPVSGG